MKYYFILFSTVLFLFNSCDKNKDCADCQAAIDHMAEKIAMLGCNPSNMNEAWSKINSACGSVMGNEYVGFMAELCNTGITKKVYCGESLWLEELRLGFQSNWMPDSVTVIVTYLEGFEAQWDVKLRNGEYKELKISGLFHPSDGDKFEFIVQNSRTDEVIGTGTKTLTWARTNEWWSVRTLHIQYNDQLELYTMEFESW